MLVKPGMLLTTMLADVLQAELRSQLEARLAAVSERVGALAQREAKQEKKRGG